MPRPTEPLREEHRELLPHIESLRAAADAVGQASPEQLRGRLDEAYDFLTKDLIPHATAEDEALYPVVAKVMGAPEATGTMRRDHVEVGSLSEELGRLRSQVDSPDSARELRRVLYGLYALVKVHFAKEEEVYLPLLDERLSAEQAREMFQAMEAAAGRAKAAHAVP